MKRISRFLRALGVDVVLPVVLLMAAPLIVLFYCLLTVAYAVGTAWKESK
jgi:hypothetical protein